MPSILLPKASGMREHLSQGYLCVEGTWKWSLAVRHLPEQVQGGHGGPQPTCLSGVRTSGHLVLLFN